jgi:hypothetical protein
VRLEKLRASPTHEEQTSRRQPFTTERLQPQKHQERRFLSLMSFFVEEERQGLQRKKPMERLD